MKTSNSPRVRSTRLQVRDLTVYATPTGLRVGNSKARVQATSEVYGSLDKGRRRAVRKALRAAGYGRHAATGVITR